MLGKLRQKKVMVLSHSVRGGTRASGRRREAKVVVRAQGEVAPTAWGAAPHGMG